MPSIIATLNTGLYRRHLRNLSTMLMDLLSRTLPHSQTLLYDGHMLAETVLPFLD